MVNECTNCSDPDVVTFPIVSELTVEASVTSSTFPLVEITSFGVDDFEASETETVDGEEVLGLIVLDLACGVSETLVVVLRD